MPGLGFEQVQRASQIQTQRMSQQQIQAVNLLALGSQDLRAEIYDAAENNPALEIVSDPFASGAETVKLKHSGSIDYTHLANSSAAGEEKAEHFQQMLENEPDTHETLQEHLLLQLNVMRLSPEEHDLGEKLIHNLDASGFHLLAPVSLLNTERGQTTGMLAHCIGLIQRMDPVGTCCVNIRESLLVQARIAGNAPPLALFLLDGHLDMLDPPVPQKIQKKILSFRSDQMKLSFAAPSAIDSLEVTVPLCEEALSFIRTLNPHPAQGFGASPAQYVTPDVFITKAAGHFEKDNSERGIVVGGDDYYYHVTLAHDTVPEVRVAPDFAAGGKTKEGKAFVSDSVRQANQFLENLSFRNATIIRICCELVRIQMPFFEKGPGSLVPLTQRQLAERLGIHESTVSRMAGSKYIQCEWGLFAVKYFFTTAVPVTDAVCTVSGPDGVQTTLAAAAVSRDAVLMAIKKIIEADSNAKTLSDQRIADMLAARGIKIARRTVAKYRAALEIGSSYRRNQS